MNNSYSKKDLYALCLPEEERSYQGDANRLVGDITKRVIHAASEGKRHIEDIPILTEKEVLLAMVLRQVKLKFPDSFVGYKTKEGSTVKFLYVDWS
jgi:hypothetical protein